MSIKILSAPQPLSEATSRDLDELFFARRALSLLKSRLGTEGLKTLLADDIAKGNAYWEKTIAASAGKHLHASVTLYASGITVEQFLTWWKKNLTNLDVMLGAHPEHYMNGHEVLETVGEHVSLFDLRFNEEVPEFVKGVDKKRWPTSLCASGVLKSGTVMGTAFHQFGDVEGGMEACVGGWLPEAAGEELVGMQRRHLAVEWGNWLRRCQEDLGVVNE